MVCEPDMVDPKTDRTNFDLEDFRTRLGPEQQKLFDFVKQGGSILGASREFGRPYSFFYRQMKQIRAEGKLYLNEAYA
jgi:molybdenum-dependent DNA-binding transcriptional regulator ModE